MRSFFAHSGTVSLQNVKYNISYVDFFSLNLKYHVDTESNYSDRNFMELRSSSGQTADGRGGCDGSIRCEWRQSSCGCWFQLACHRGARSGKSQSAIVPQFRFQYINWKCLWLVNQLSGRLGQNFLQSLNSYRNPRHVNCEQLRFSNLTVGRQRIWTCLSWLARLEKYISILFILCVLTVHWLLSISHHYSLFIV